MPHERGAPGARGGVAIVPPGLHDVASAFCVRLFCRRAGCGLDACANRRGGRPTPVSLCPERKYQPICGRWRVGTPSSASRCSPGSSLKRPCHQPRACRRQASCWIAAGAARRSPTAARTARISASPSARWSRAATRTEINLHSVDRGLQTIRPVGQVRHGRRPAGRVRAGGVPRQEAPPLHPVDLCPRCAPERKIAAEKQRGRPLERPHIA